MKIKEIIYKNHAVSPRRTKKILQLLRPFNAEVLQLKADKARGLQNHFE